MSKPVCKFYSYNRNCKFGKNCRYLHSESQRPPPLQDFTDSHEETVRETLDSSYPSQGNQQSDNAQGNHESPVNNSLSTDLPAPISVTENQYRNEIKHEGVNRHSHISEPRKICRYFVQHGRCTFGRNCRFAHNVTDNRKSNDSQHVRDIPPRFQRKAQAPHTSNDLEKDVIAIQTSPAEGGSFIPSDHKTDSQVQEAQDVEDQSGTEGSSKASGSLGRICSYFRSGYCYRGRNCKFSHAYSNRQSDQRRPQKSPLESEKNVGGENGASRHQAKPLAYVKPVVQHRTLAFRPPGIQQIVSLSELEKDGTQKYRQFDINYLQKRYQDRKTSNQSPENELEDFTIDVIFAPSDPDWPFDVKAYDLQLTLAKNYPKELMTVKVPADKQDLPESIRRYLEVSIAEWLTNRGENYLKDGEAELVVRPFFKWLDRNFEDLMTEALKQLRRELTAKAAGMEFIPADQLKAKYTSAEVVDEEGDDSEDDSGSKSEDYDDSSDECLESDDESDSASEDGEKRPSLSLDTEKKGTEIILRHLQLKQNASSLLFEKLRLILQCSRCKTHSEVNVSHGKVLAVGCDKCSHEMLVKFRPTLAHQFSSIIGYLDLDNCQAFDLILQECVAIISCLGCSKMTKIDGLASGQMVDGWCRACNARFKFATESVKFYHLEPSGVVTDDKTDVEVVRPKSRKPPKDPAIREGYPLPDFGTCKHYKQSYRWLRFPCCGKAYPCDVCHDKKEDHEMVMATRMICGHCCKEQNFSGARPCTSCNQHMTKVHSAHWEGGSGCRDKITMSKGDQQKYKNMNKTLSNHKKKVQSSGSSKKKNTKLRHA